MTQLFAPVVYAMEVERGQIQGPRMGGHHYREPSPSHEAALQRPFQQPSEHGTGWNLLASPSPQALAKALDILQNTLEGSPSLTSEAYQYRLGIKTLNAQAERFQLKLSRKAKGASSSAERLLTTRIVKGNLAITFSSAPLTQEDDLLNLFKSGFVRKVSAMLLQKCHWLF